MPQIKQHIATITAIKNIKPNIQNANANFDDDRHSVPSDGTGRILDGYSSTENKTKGIVRIKLRCHNIAKVPVTLYLRSLLMRSNSICGAVTASELNTSILANC